MKLPVSKYHHHQQQQQQPPNQCNSSPPCSLGLLKNDHFVSLSL
jgi:hypothetical protein